MSKRHQSSRRRSYGRRQHELRERVDRRPATTGIELDHGDRDADGDGFGFLDLDAGGRRLSFVVGD
jgi:hypothetical protein